jgi:hypothetical protein
MSETFVDQVLTGDALWTEIDDWVERWHAGSGGSELHHFLGMTWPEYKLWVEQPSTLRVILAARELTKDVDELINEPDEFAVAARSLTPDERNTVLQWLRRTGRLQT